MGLFDFLGVKGNTSKTITLPYIPRNINELMALPGAQLKDEFEVAALCVAVLCNWENDRNATIEMLNFLRGPRPLSPMDQQFLRDRLAGKQYKTYSFFHGATVVSLRKKPSTGQWFIWEIFFLSDIRTPAAQDPWA